MESVCRMNVFQNLKIRMPDCNTYTLYCKCNATSDWITSFLVWYHASATLFKEPWSCDILSRGYYVTSLFVGWQAGSHWVYAQHTTVHLHCLFEGKYNLLIRTGIAVFKIFIWRGMSLDCYTHSTTKIVRGWCSSLVFRRRKTKFPTVYPTIYPTPK